MTYCDVTRRLSIRKFVSESMSESRTLLATLYSTLDCAYSTVHTLSTVDCHTHIQLATIATTQCGRAMGHGQREAWSWRLLEASLCLS